MLNEMSHPHNFAPADDVTDEYGNVFMIDRCVDCGVTVAGEKYADLDGAEQWAGECKVAAAAARAHLGDGSTLTYNPFAALAR